MLTSSQRPEPDSIMQMQQAEARIEPDAFNSWLQAGVPESRIVTAVLDAVKDGSGDVASAIVRYAAAYKARLCLWTAQATTVCARPCRAMWHLSSCCARPQWA